MIAPDDPQNDIPDDFIEQVKDVLENLYDIPYLQRHALAAFINTEAASAKRLQGQTLRRKILELLEYLSPGVSVNFRSPQARLYNLLHLRYVEGMTVQQAANKLGISPRQAYRDLRKGEERIAMLLWEEIHSEGGTEIDELAANHEEIEMPAYSPKMSRVNINSLVLQSLKAVSSLAELRSIAVAFSEAQSAAFFYSDPVVAQQIITSVISHTLQSIQNCELGIAIEEKADKLHLILSFDHARPDGDSVILDQATKTLTSKLGWVIEEYAEDARHHVAVQISSQKASILVIDDNEGIIDLFKRFLVGVECQVIGATDSGEGIRQAKTVKPDVVFLDVMMPDVDGWEVLQILRNHESTRRIPVVICSVFNDPELALSLGAEQVMSKPIRQENLIAVLQNLGIV
ncbi:MAG: response regulator [Anaerolineales bacterium]|nr:response regulator [Anaerolineales bacterium]